MVPHLITALAGPLSELEERILEAAPVIERWFRQEWMEHTPPIYAAARVHNAGFKLATLDLDLFPRGWHLLAESTMPLAVLAAQAAIEKICPEARRLLIVPENGAPADADLASLHRLQQIFRMAGLEVRFGSLDPALNATTQLAHPDASAPMPLEPIQRHKTRLHTQDFEPCSVLLCNALGAGVPGILEDLFGQHLLPPLQAGWSTRRRSRHRSFYMDAAKRFGKLIGVDPWLLAPFADAGSTDSPQAIAALRERANALLARIRRKYRSYGIQEQPCLLLASDAGPRGVPVQIIRDPREIDPTTLPAEVLLQEGVPTRERVDAAVAESWVYSIDRHIVGGYYCVHDGDASEMCDACSSFVPQAIAEPPQLPRAGAPDHNRFYMYGVIARLALVAASYELEATDPEWLSLQDEEE